MNRVLKYGHGAIKDTEDIKKLSKFIKEKICDKEGLVIVVSGTEKRKEDVLKEAESSGLQISREKFEDLMIAVEEETAVMLGIAMENIGLENKVITSNVAEISDDEYGAKKRSVDTSKIEEALADGNIVIATPYHRLGNYGSIEKYGAGGSDITAVAIAVQLGAECNIYGVSDGIYSSPLPDKSNAKKIDSISYEELMELTITGGGEPAVGAVELAKQYKVPLYIGKAFEEKQGGTYVMNQNLMVGKAPVTGISAASGCSIYSVRGIENSGDLQVKLFELLSENDISVDMITQQMEKDGTRSISFSLTAEQEADFEKALSSSDIFKDVKVSKQENMAIVSVIGVGMASYSGVAGKVFSVLAQERINYYQVTTSEISISVTVDDKDRGKAVIALGDRFGL